MRILAIVAITTFLAASPEAGAASPPYLVLDINAQPASFASGSPSAMRVASGGVYFIALGGIATSLWHTDGTGEGTQRLERVTLFESAAVGASLFYAGQTSDRAGLWLSDGSAAGATLLLSTPRSFVALPPNRLTALGSIVLFSHGDTEHGRELWRSDGTEAGTHRVTDLAAGPASALDAFDNRPLAVAGGLAYFFANETNVGFELWASDGTTAGTRLVRRFVAPPNPSGDFRGRYLTAAAGRVWFAYANGLGETELWVSDGSDAGTHGLGEARVDGFDGGAGEPLVTAVGDLVYFAGTRPGEGRELWVSDGTEEGTERVVDLDPGPDGSNPRLMVVSGSALFFLADQNAESGPRVFGQLWRADGGVLTALKPKGGAFSLALSDDGTLYFAGEEESCPFVCPDFSRLWRSDGTPAGTLPVENSPLRPRTLTPFGTIVLFAGTDDAGDVELWRSDGTAAGTFLVKDLFVQTDSSSPAALTAVGDRVYFRADGGDGVDLWTSDGTPGGTLQLTDFDTPQFEAPPANFSPLGDALLFSAHGDAVRGLWRSDGSAPGTRRIAALQEDVAQVATAEAGAYFITGGAPAPTLWRSNGSEGGTSAVAALSGFASNLVAAGSRAYFEVADDTPGIELWTSDGTEAGTVRVGGITGAAPLPQADRLNPFGERVVFQQGLCNPFAVDPNVPLWLADGDSARLLSEETCVGAPMADMGEHLLFLSRHPEGTTLWSTDGTAVGTVPITEVGTQSTAGVTRVGDRALFLGFDDRLNGLLWSSDGTASGTAVVAEVDRGGGLIELSVAAVNASRAYLLVSRRDFIANQVVVQEIWSTDGTAAGTEMLFAPLADLGSAIDTLSPSPVAVTSERLFLPVNEENTGTELGGAVLNEDTTCPVDCDDDGSATIAELTAAAGMALGEPSARCASVGRLRRVTVDQIVAGVACRG